MANLGFRHVIEKPYSLLRDLCGAAAQPVGLRCRDNPCSLTIRTICGIRSADPNGGTNP